MKGSPTKIHNKLKLGSKRQRNTHKSDFNLMHEQPLSSFIDHCNNQENEHPNFKNTKEESTQYQQQIIKLQSQVKQLLDKQI
jgi:hypothetical protein